MTQDRGKEGGVFSRRLLQVQGPRQVYGIRRLAIRHWLAWATLLVGFQVAAHPFLQNSWWVVVETNQILCRVSATLREVAVAQRLGDATNAVAVEPLVAALKAHADYMTRTIQVSADGQSLSGEVLDFKLMTARNADVAADSPLLLDQIYAVFDLEFPLPAGTRELNFGQTTLQDFRYAPGVPWDVTHSLLVKDSDQRELGAGLVRADLPYVLDLGTTSSPLTAGPAPRTPESAALDDAAAASPHVRFTEYLKLGVSHILHGYDHLLFLAALALAAATVGDFLKLILTFTLAHSITVTLSALNLVRLPAAFVEPFIAATIIFVALENVLVPGSVSSPRRLAVAFGFGLVHGLGFASGLNQALGTAGGAALALAIFAFCLGVELGHLAVGLPFWSVIRAGRAEWGDHFGRQILRYGSLAVAAGGAYFLIAALRQYA
ncbi:MAG TPA: HupE/UreJ family protein [Verrucomicrobiota bacterium]|nr:HupE/UreJ family protein [Verrucomicrobiota bacterium]